MNEAKFAKLHKKITEIYKIKLRKNQKIIEIR